MLPDWKRSAAAPAAPLSLRELDGYARGCVNLLERSKDEEAEALPKTTRSPNKIWIMALGQGLQLTMVIPLAAFKDPEPATVLPATAPRFYIPAEQVPGFEPEPDAAQRSLRRKRACVQPAEG